MQSAASQSSSSAVEANNAFLQHYSYLERFHAAVSRMISEFLDTSGNSTSIAGAINNHLIAASQSIDMALNTEMYANDLVEELEEKENRILEYHEECLKNFYEVQVVQKELDKCKKKLDDRDKEILDLKEKLFEKERTIEVRNILDFILNEVTDREAKEEESHMTASQSEASEDVEEIRPDSAESVNGASIKRKERYGCGQCCAGPSTSTTTPAEEEQNTYLRGEHEGISTIQPKSSNGVSMKRKERYGCGQCCAAPSTSTTTPAEEEQNTYLRGEHEGIPVIQCQSSKEQTQIDESRPSTFFIGPQLPKEQMNRIMVRCNDFSKKESSGSKTEGEERNRKRARYEEVPIHRMEFPNYADPSAASYNLEAQSWQNYNSHPYWNQAGPAASMPAQNDQQRPVPTCIFCSELHYSNSCPLYPSLDGKLARAIELNICTRCLGTHSAESCKSRNMCRSDKCGASHNKIFCPLKYRRYRN